jgi:hypothetical protein
LKSVASARRKADVSSSRQQPADCKKMGRAAAGSTAVRFFPLLAA